MESWRVTQEGALTVLKALEIGRKTQKSLGWLHGWLWTQVESRHLPNHRIQDGQVLRRL